MKNKIINSLVSVGFSFAIAFIIMLFASMIVSKCEDPNAVTETAAIIILFGSALICGIITAVRSGGDPLTAVMSAFIYVAIILIFSFALSSLLSGGIEPYSMGRRALFAAAAAAAVFVGSLIGTKRKRRSKKRTPASVRAGIKKKHA